MSATRHIKLAGSRVRSSRAVLTTMGLAQARPNYSWAIAHALRINCNMFFPAPVAPTNIRGTLVCIITCRNACAIWPWLARL